MYYQTNCVYNYASQASVTLLMQVFSLSDSIVYKYIWKMGEKHPVCTTNRKYVLYLHFLLCRRHSATGKLFLTDAWVTRGNAGSLNPLVLEGNMKFLQRGQRYAQAGNDGWNMGGPLSAIILPYPALIYLIYVHLDINLLHLILGKKKLLLCHRSN